MRKIETGQQYLIKSFSQAIKGAHRTKLLSMGIIPGAIINIIRRAPLGGPIQLQVNNASISMRNRELDLLTLEILN